MQTNSFTSNFVKISFGTIAVIGIFVAYAVLDTASYTKAQSTTTAPAEVDPILGNELQAAITTIKGLKMDGAIFKDQAFLSLSDITVEILPQPVGRDNPFLPLPPKAGYPLPEKK